MEMDIRLKVMLSAVAAALATVAGIALLWHPLGLPVTARRGALVVTVVAMLILLLAVATAVELWVRRPLARVAASASGTSSDPVADPVAAIDRHLQALQNNLFQSRAELERGWAHCRDVEQALREAEERYAVAIRHSGDGAWEWDLRSDGFTLAPRWKSMLGFAEEEIPDTREAWRARVHPDDLTGFDLALENLLRGNTPRLEHELRLLHKDGAWRWSLCRAVAVRHASGKAYRLIGLDTDITRVKRVEDVLMRIADGTASEIGEGFFRNLVSNFALALNVEAAFITECLDFPTTRLRTLAFWQAETFRDNFEYDLQGTPCEGVIAGTSCFIPSHLSEQYPIEVGWESYLGVPIFGIEGRVVGHLVFLDRRQMTDDMLVTPIYQIFTARAGAEIECRHAIEALKAYSG